MEKTFRMWFKTHTGQSSAFHAADTYHGYLEKNSVVTVLVFMTHYILHVNVLFRQNVCLCFPRHPTDSMIILVYCGCLPKDWGMTFEWNNILITI